ncbi:cytoplasmic dynein 2 intermediate chain 2-like isoform X2 [Macrosteles quadrilineatus]|uniref:cytoplasmic dynein 2 intermediate chain 2-like isoform X2 n=1 Tax=Macrosteles quadrilineatus TaxID=74068 RepID=UPI0023E1AECA|nr:cytoplasmic dynein 2 intermediate chain 2-like isoform X2 [Macrosteles quadrilineatus]
MFTDCEVVSSGFPAGSKLSRDNEDSSTQTLDIRRENQNTQTANAQTTGVEELLNIPNTTEGVKVVDLSWSATGSVLAVASCHTLHSGWCHHQGYVTLHNIDKDSRIPSCTLNATSCVRSVSMHPYLSSIVAAGTITGEVFVWDTAGETSKTLAKVTAASHNDSVTEVRWVLGTGTSVYLVSAAHDGYLILWKVSPHLSSYQLMERYTFDLSSSKAGVSAFAFPHHQQDVFVVCLEGGAVKHCSTTVAKPVTSVRSLQPLKDPVISCFEQHPATVTSVEFSPNHDNVFATVATDQAIRIWCLLQRCCQRVIWCGAMVGLSWSPVQAHVLAAWGHSNNVKLYNSNTGDDLISLAPDGRKDKAQISCVRFNCKSTGLLGVGDLGGRVEVWEIPLLVSTKGEILK